MPSRAKYRRVTDLYVTGKELVLKDGSVLWMQVLNPFEADEARHDAQTTRARLVLALKEHGSEELTKVEGQLASRDRADIVAYIADLRAGERWLKIMDDIRNDPDWQERLDIVERHDELMARPPEDAERKLYDQINADYVAEVNARLSDERAFETKRLDDLSYDELRDEYKQLWIDQRGGDVAYAEYQLTEWWYAARACDGVQRDDGTWDHSACDGHQLRVWESKAEVRALPKELQDALAHCMGELNMTVRQAKNSDRPGSFFESSPRPNEQEASTASTPTEALSEHPGTSPQPSPTP